MSVRCFYNENDPFATAWLRELQRDGQIAEGPVDERSIADVDADALRGYARCHFFAGIGGWDYALALAGWPDARPVWTGSCPCQPFSAAGKQSGSADARHLWPQWLRLIRECRPDTILGEQVEGAVGFGWIDRVFADLEAEGYACGSAVLGAHSVGAPHIRQRLFWVAHTAAPRQQPEGQGTEAEAWDEARLWRSERGCASGGLADATSFGTTREFGEEGRSRRAHRIEPHSCGKDGGLADTDGGQSGHGGLQRSGQHRQRPQDGGAGERMGHTDSSGRQSRNAFGFGTSTRSEQSSHPGPHGGLGDRLSDGLEGPGERGPRRSFPPPWTASVAIPCADGKFRRVAANGQAQAEPALFPLAHGVPARMGTLRGAGNAITPQVAAAFVRAFLESEQR